jgi:hypothetical protein
MRRYSILAVVLASLVVTASAEAGFKSYTLGFADRGDYIVARQKVCTDYSAHIRFVWRLDSPSGGVRHFYYWGYNPAGCGRFALRHVDTFPSGRYWTRVTLRPRGAGRYDVSNWHRLRIW